MSQLRAVLATSSMERYASASLALLRFHFLTICLFLNDVLILPYFFFASSSRSGRYSPVSRNFVIVAMAFFAFLSTPVSRSLLFGRAAFARFLVRVVMEIVSFL